MSQSDKLDGTQIAEWRKRIKDKIFRDFCGEPNEAHGTKLQAQFDALCDMALTATRPEVQALSASPASAPSQPAEGPSAQYIEDCLSTSSACRNNNPGANWCCTRVAKPAEGPTPESDAVLEAAERVSHLLSEVGDFMRDLERRLNAAWGDLATAHNAYSAVEQVNLQLQAELAALRASSTTPTKEEP